MVIFTFEGPTVLYVHPSAVDAEGYFEAIAVENDEYRCPIVGSSATVQAAIVE